jgi:cobalt/nickel transport system permease protein
MAFGHDEIDKYARTSRFYTFDPRVKLASTILFVIAVALLRDIAVLFWALLFIILLIEVSGVPLVHMAENYAIAFPFIAFASLTMFLTSGPESALAIAMRITTSVLALLLMIATTPFFDTLRALRWFKVPPLICNLVMFTYRFIFVLLDEMGRMRLARKSRGFTGGRSLFDKEAFKTISYTIGMVFVRSNVRAGRIYDALLSRGYSGEIKTLTLLKVKARDAAMGLLYVSLSIFLIASQQGVVPWMS